LTPVSVVSLVIVQSDKSDLSDKSDELPVWFPCNARATSDCWLLCNRRDACTTLWSTGGTPVLLSYSCRCGGRLRRPPLRRFL